MSDVSSRSMMQKTSEEYRVFGKSIVPGIALGRAFFLETSPLQVHELTLPQEEVEHEIHRYYKALQRSKSDIVALKQEILGKQELHEVSSILQAHLEIIKDPLLTEEVVNTIRKDRKNAEYVFSSVMGKIEESLFSVQSESSSLVDRVQDIHDISNRVIGHLCCQHKSSLGESDQNIIVVAKELTPSEVASANPAYIRGFVSLLGAVTSHTAIVSRAKNIPYVANLPEEIWERWGISKKKSPLAAEKDLVAFFGDKVSPKLHLQLISYARKFCPALHHKIQHCPICLQISKHTKK